MKNYAGKCLAAMGVLCMAFSLFGCSQKTAKPTGELSSISISQNHMSRTFCYSFYARKETDGCFLDAWCLLENGEDYTDIDFECVEITAEEFSRFIELDKKYNFCSHIKKEKKRNKIIFILDETVNCFSVKYGSECFNIDTSGEYYNAVYDCFLQLAKKYGENIK